MKRHAIGRFLVLAALVLMPLVAGCATARWTEAQQNDTIEAYEAFLKQSPRSEFSVRAKARLDELYEERDWQRASAQDTLAAYESFLARYPRGTFAKSAGTKLEMLSFQQAQVADTLESYAVFLEHFPGSILASLAKSRTATLWAQKVRSANTISDCEYLLRQFPGSPIAAEVNRKLEELSFQKAAGSNTAEAYEAFLKKFSAGAFADETRVRIAKIKEAENKERERLAQLAREEKDRLAREAEAEMERKNQELDRAWKKAQKVNTVEAYQAFLDRYPDSPAAAKTRQYLSTQRLEGWIQEVNRNAGTLVLKTSMGNREVVYLARDVKVGRKGDALSLQDVRSGESVMIEYQSLPNKPVGKTISVGYSVSHCSCGTSCSCPLSRGCRVIRY